MSKVFNMTGGGTDTSEDTVSAEKVLSGVTFHDKDGEAGTGNIPTKTASDMTASGASVTAPAGYYASAASKSVASGTAGTPTASKGTVSNNSISVTPSVTNTTGYITGGTKSGTAVTVSASELVSGTKSITASGETDVTNYQKASVAAGSAKTPATTITANPTISVNSSTGVITASVSKTQSITPTVSAGYVSSGTAGNATISGSATQQLTTQAAKTVTPGTSSQTAVAAGRYTTGAVTVAGDANLAAGNIKSGVSIFGVTGTYITAVLNITAPSGATVTVKKGSTTVNTHTATGSAVAVNVHETGTYTVTATDGSDTASNTASITADGQSVNISLGVIPEDVNDATWAQISEVSQAGTGDTYWDVGDAKEITLNGTIGTKAFSNVKLCVFILDFNHKENGVADNNILWGGFKTALSNGVDVALRDWTADQSFGDYKTDGTKLFTMNHWGNYNYGGWISCDLRYDILGAVETAPSGYGSARTTAATGSNATTAAITSPVSNTLMAALPSDFRSVLRLRTHYVDSKGNKSNVDANVTAVTDAISLLAEFEVFGARSYANDYEKNHQAQMAYYANGNSKVKYAHDATTRTVIWWECSAYYNDTHNFCRVNSNGNANTNRADNSIALAPAFKT